MRIVRTAVTGPAGEEGGTAASGAIGDRRSIDPDALGYWLARGWKVDANDDGVADDTGPAGAYVPVTSLLLSDLRPASPTVGLVRIGLAADTTAPTVPTGLTVTPGNTQNAVSWTASTDAVGVVGYRLYRGGALIVTQAGTSYTDTGLTNGTSYTYTVLAYDAAGNASALTSGVSGTPSAGATAPGAPTGLTGTPATTSVALTWTAPASNGGSAITDYLVEYKATASGTWLTFSDGTSTTAAATVTGLISSTSYDFRVSAINAVGTGSASSTYTASTTAASTLAADTFNRADGAITAASTSGGQTWVAAGGVFNVLTNQAKIASYGAVGNLAGGAAYIECSNADVTVSVDMPTIVGGTGLILRYVDTTHFYYVTASGSGGSLTLGKYNAGSTALITGAAGDVASGDTVTVVMSGSSFTLKRTRSGTTTTLGTVTDSAISGTKHGIALGATGSVADRWDNFLVTSP